MLPPPHAAACYSLLKTTATGILSLLLASACLSCNSGRRDIPLSPGNEPQCLTADAYAQAEHSLRPRLKARVLTDEVSFLDEDLRDEHLFVQLRHRWNTLRTGSSVIDYRVHVSIEVDGQPLEQVPPTTEALAARTGETPHSDAVETARDLIIWATGGVAILSEEVTKQPSHVQLLALLGRKPCKRDNCENMQLMLTKPVEQSAPAALVLQFDFLIEDDESIVRRACPPHNVLRVELPPGDTLESRLSTLFQNGKVRVRHERKVH